MKRAFELKRAPRRAGDRGRRHAVRAPSTSSRARCRSRPTRSPRRRGCAGDQACRTRDGSGGSDHLLFRRPPPRSARSASPRTPARRRPGSDLVEVAALEYAAKGIRINTPQPGHARHVDVARPRSSALACEPRSSANRCWQARDGAPKWQRRRYWPARAMLAIRRAIRIRVARRCAPAPPPHARTTIRDQPSRARRPIAREACMIVFLESITGCGGARRIPPHRRADARSRQGEVPRAERPIRDARRPRASTAVLDARVCSR